MHLFDLYDVFYDYNMSWLPCMWIAGLELTIPEGTSFPSVSHCNGVAQVFRAMRVPFYMGMQLLPDITLTAHWNCSWS